MTKMNKTVRINGMWQFVLLIFVSIAFASCSSDDDDEKLIDVPQELIGTWNMGGALQITFNADGTGFLSGDFGEEEMLAPMRLSRSSMTTIRFTYTYNSEERTIEINIAGEKERWHVERLEDGILVVIDSEGDKLSFVKDGGTTPDVPDINYEPCPLATLIGDWGVAGHALYGFNEDGYIKWFLDDGEHFEYGGMYTYDEKDGVLITPDRGRAEIRKVTENIILMTETGIGEGRDAPFLLTRVTDTPFAVADISALYDKMWTMVGVATLDDEPVYPWTYYFDSKGVWSSSVLGETMGGTFVYDARTKTIVLSMFGTEQSYKVLNLTEDDLIMDNQGTKMELVALPKK